VVVFAILGYPEELFGLKQPIVGPETFCEEGGEKVSVGYNCRDLRLDIDWTWSLRGRVVQPKEIRFFRSIRSCESWQQHCDGNTYHHYYIPSNSRIISNLFNKPSDPRRFRTVVDWLLSKVTLQSHPLSPLLSSSSSPPPSNSPSLVPLCRTSGASLLQTAAHILRFRDTYHL
jgi:hypothetical protein